MNEIPKEIREQAKQFFDTYDSNKNGAIELKELKPLVEEIAKRLGMPMPSEEELTKGMRELDINENGVLEFEEFLPFYAQVYQIFQKEKPVENI